MSGASLWGAQAPVDPAPALDGDTTADIAIVGGGYGGLWSAIRLKERDPSVDVILLERAVCGAGASGRNGGQAHGWWRQLALLEELCGPDEALRLVREADGVLDELEHLQAIGRVDADVARTGLLWTASATAQLGAWDEVMAHAATRGAEPWQALTAAQARERSGSPAIVGGVLELPAVALHPGKLARGLRTWARELGVRVHEHTAVTDVEAEAGRATVVTPRGRVTAGRVVLTTGPWAARRRELRSRLYVVASQILATAPIPDRLRELGLEPDRRMHDSQERVLYWGTTRDARIVFGRGGGTVAFGGHIGPAFRDSARWAADATAELHRIYPSLADVPIERTWAGPVERTTSGLPIVGRLGGHDALLVATGWSGTGIVQTALAAHMIASLALGADDAWSRSALVDAPVARRLPPEPVRWLGAQVVRDAVMRRGRAQVAGEAPGALTSAIADLVPSGLARR